MSEEEGISCYICFESDPLPLTLACGCNGYAHPTCLMKYAYHRNSHFCSICRRQDPRMVIQYTSGLDWKMVFYVLLIIVLTGLYSIPIYIIHKLDVSDATLVVKVFKTVASIVSICPVIASVCTFWYLFYRYRMSFVKKGARVTWVDRGSWC